MEAMCASKAVMGPVTQGLTLTGLTSANLARDSTPRSLNAATCSSAPILCRQAGGGGAGVSGRAAASCAPVGLRFSRRSLSQSAKYHQKISPLMKRSHRAGVVCMGVGFEPTYNDDDYITLGLAHCFEKDGNAKLQDRFIVEPIPAGGLECMENGGVTCYKFVTAVHLGKVLSQDVMTLPSEFHVGRFCDEFDFRVKCAARTWQRQHPRENLMHLVPVGTVRSEYNFSVEVKRVLNTENIVNDDDNIKQDLSIDVYGRAKDTNEAANEIEKLYNV